MIAAYIFLLLSIQQVCHVAIGTPVEELTFDELEDIHFESNDKSNISDILPSWLVNCKNLSTTAQEVLQVVQNISTWLYQKPVTIIKDFDDLRKCSGLLKPICLVNGLMKVVNDFQTIQHEVQSRVNITDTLFKKVIKELVWCFLHASDDQPESQLMEELFMEMDINR
ncbi:uncharacterized protein LOC106661979 [Cimex lectularius]|uniref:Uncharacterized protein n=1 Tax=Cimex lectularius TaxID=79782 RepID=A0A8I6RDK0_CIMLE|nr:uncharacterized protein LOC106661979 [Cimex lectularius]